MIEGAKMVVCGECARLGTPYVEVKPRRPAKGFVKPVRRKVKALPTVVEASLELKDDYSLLVRRARERLGLSHEDLGRKIGEKVSVLRKIETGKMVPDNRLATKLEHALHIRLLVPASQPKAAPKTILPPRRGVTLGEVAEVRKRRESEGERGR